jgi:hypothetical protein
LPPSVPQSLCYRKSAKRNFTRPPLLAHTKNYSGSNFRNRLSDYDVMALPTTEEFEFQELENSGDFRVLRLHPAKSRSEPIIFDLEHLSLSEPPKFDAISYTWDGQAFEHEAYSSGKRFLITRNCRDILVNMRLPNHSCMLWIDQICIDQSSEKDRSNNICQMACIYEQATSVVIWTGQCDGRITSLISRMEESLIKATRDHGFDPRLVEFTTQHGDGMTLIPLTLIWNFLT